MDALTPDRAAGSRLALFGLSVIGPLLCAAGAGACAYQPSSFRGQSAGSEFTGERATVGCLDVAVAGRRDAAVGHAVEIQFANRCDRAVVVDFTALRAVGRDDGGHEHPLSIHDPRREIRPLDLEARTIGREVFEIRSRAKGPASPSRLRSTCLDVGRISAPPGPPRWLCARPSASAAREAP
jgi:hypothetical protein